MNKNNFKFVSGELLQKNADICFCTKSEEIIQKQISNTPVKLVYIDFFDPKNIHQYKKIFVYTHDILSFIKKFFEHLDRDTIIITHNSDASFDSSFTKLLNSNKIKKWYTQNKNFKHDKLFALPIGIANSQWPHGNQEILNEIKELNLPKKRTIYKNFNITTNPQKRLAVESITHSNNIIMDSNKNYKEYLKCVAESYFVICPPGNGVDCHRIWECLILGAVPIVEQHVAFDQFQHLPILFIDSWHEVTQNFLEKNINLTTKFNNIIAELTIEHWNKTIL